MYRKIQIFTYISNIERAYKFISFYYFFGKANLVSHPYAPEKLRRLGKRVTLLYHNSRKDIYLVQYEQLFYHFDRRKATVRIYIKEYTLL